ncbi:MAG: ABC transporter permease, partial [Propionibacterium sp.]|nr:ABC transporter permease [Propionibacterium sp.]
FPMWGALLVLLGWCVVPALLGAVFTVRKDV